jgi:hypothetical protein
MVTKDQIAAWKNLREGLEIAEQLEAERGLAFTAEEKETLKLLRRHLPEIEALFANLSRWWPSSRTGAE